MTDLRVMDSMMVYLEDNVTDMNCSNVSSLLCILYTINLLHPGSADLCVGTDHEPEQDAIRFRAQGPHDGWGCRQTAFHRLRCNRADY